MEVKEEDIRDIDDELRYKIVNYIDEKKGRPKEIDHSLWYRLKKKERRVSDNTLRILLQKLTPSEFAEIVSGKKADVIEITSKKTAIEWVNWAMTRLNYIIETYPELRQMVADNLHKIMLKIRTEKHEVPITKEHIDKFELVLKQKGVSKKVFSERVNYLRHALDEMGWVLSEDRLLGFLVEKQSESVTLAQHYSKALKLFIKEVLKDDLLYRAFKTPNAETSRSIPEEVLDIDFHRKVFDYIPHLGAKAYYLLLAESGWRPSEIMGLRLSNVDFEKGIITLNKISKSKRAYITFFHPETLKWFKKWYLPYRESWVEAQAKNVEKIGQDAEAFKQKLFPFKDDSIREAVREGVKRIKPELADSFTLYYLRHFWSTYVRRQNAPADIVNLLQGRAPPKEFKILVEGYTHYSIEDLRKVFEKYAPRLLSNS